MSDRKQRDSYIDILKAIGIISIVFGHCARWENAVFAYLYHIMIFFFVAGCCISETHIKTPEKYIGRTILKNGYLLVFYNALFAILHNVFIKLNILAGTEYGLGDIVRAILGGIAFNYSELFLGAFWFIPMYLVAVILFVITLHTCDKATSAVLSSQTEHPWSDRIKTAFEVMACCIYLLLALALNTKSIQLNYHMQTSFLAIPVLFAGYYYKKHKNTLERFVSIYGIVPAFLILVGILKLNIGIIELSVDSIINIWLFYPTTLVGIYFCMALGKLLNKWKISSNLFAVVGKYSFHIMALHFLCFKMVDLVLHKIYNIEDVHILSGYPTSGFPVRWIYLLLGVFLPVVVIQSIRWVLKTVKNKVLAVCKNP